MAGCADFALAIDTDFRSLRQALQDDEASCFKKSPGLLLSYVHGGPMVIVALPEGHQAPACRLLRRQTRGNSKPRTSQGCHPRSRQVYYKARLGGSDACRLLHSSMISVAASKAS